MKNATHSNQTTSMGVDEPGRTKHIIRAVAVAAVALVGSMLLTSTPADAATRDGASAQCYTNNALQSWAERGDADSHIMLTLPRSLARGRTYVRYHVASDGGGAFYSGWFYADNAGLPGPYGAAFSSGTKTWTGPTGQTIWGLVFRLANTVPGSRHTISQQRYVYQDGRLYGGAWEHVSRVAC